MAIYDHLKVKEVLWGTGGALGAKGLESTTNTLYNLLLKGGGE